jgi:hypothetical protein
VRIISICVVVLGFAAGASEAKGETFGSDLGFLRKHVNVVVLEQGEARVVVVPAWQGRVATSTASGDSGTSFGWINRGLIASGKTQPHINPFGGEDRLWLGPEGGQFSLFFKAGDAFDLEHWQTPAVIDTDSWPIVSQELARVRFLRDVKLTNRAGTTFDIRIERTIRMIGASEIAESCPQVAATGGGRARRRRPSAARSGGAAGAAAAAADAGAALAATEVLRSVGFQSENRLTNTGGAPWTRAGGLVSIWSMGMFAPSPATTVVVPLAAAARGKRAVVNDAYFGKVGRDRLVVKQGAVFFRADGGKRGKIGVRPPFARPVLGSFDGENQTLTVVWYTQPRGARPYVNSLWEQQKDPFAGDVVNSYNDGPPAPGVAPLGPFYELETSSPGAELAPGASLDHTHRTIHFQGDRPALDRMAHACLGVPLAAIESAFKR